jgi:hypothetical protein
MVGSARMLDARGSLMWLRRFARTTPGVVVLIALSVAASCLVAGVVCAAQLNQRIAEHNGVLERTEPFAYAAQNLYAALSASDAAAASEFLSGGTQTLPMRERYQQSLAGAASALADATAGATDPETRTGAAEISAQLATYTGLIEAARANNLQKFPIGSAYLREASSLMQTELLPSAEKMYDRDMTAVEHEQRRAATAPTTGLVLLGFALAMIGIASVIMHARTNRQFNVGLVTAAVVVGLVITWVVAASQLAANDLERARVESTVRFEQLAKARILAQQSRTDETLELIARGDVTAREVSFHGHIEGLVTALGSGSSAAKEAVQKWIASHDKQVAAYLAGDYGGALEQAIGPDPLASAAQFAIVESSLRNDIEQTRGAVRDRVAAAGNFLAWSPTGTLLLMTVAASASVAGLWPRLKEFL